MKYYIINEDQLAELVALTTKIDDIHDIKHAVEQLELPDWATHEMKVRNETLHRD